MAELSYPVAAALTLVCEVPVYVAVLGRGAGTSVRRAVAIGSVVNVVSHPALWFVLVPWFRSRTGEHWTAVAIAEAIVWCGEGAAAALALPDRRRWRVAAVAACAANACSLALGLVLYWLRAS